MEKGWDVIDGAVVVGAPENVMYVLSIVEIN
jgi:hypothetical protein